MNCNCSVRSQPDTTDHFSLINSNSNNSGGFMHFNKVFKDKVVLVTGSSRGIGKACIELFSEYGSSVVIHYQKNSQAAKNVQKSIKTDSVIIQAELSTEDGCISLINETKKIFGKIDILVVNHGIWERAEIGRISKCDVDKMLDLNLKSLFYLTRESVPLFDKKTGGSIVFISSTAGQRGEPFYSHYAASKGAVVALAKSLAVELGRSKIRVNAVAPGWVITDMTNHVLKSEYLKEVEAAIPLGKVATPVDIAHSILFLSSHYANHITGETLNVNGGSVLNG